MRYSAALSPLVPMLLLSACSAAVGSAPAPGGGVVSLDYCADQMVLGLVPRDRILAVSPEADSDRTFSAPRARDIARSRPILEELLRLRPRYAVRLYGGAPGIDKQLAAAGITVVQLGAPNSLAEVEPELRRIGDEVGSPVLAAKRIAEWRANLAAVPAAPEGSRPTILYVTPGDVTTGPGGFVGDVIAKTGFRSVRTAPGWGSLPLEDMVRRRPDAVLRAFFDSPRHRQDHWSSSSHPRLQFLLAGRPMVSAPGSALGCGNWLAGDTVRQMGELRAKMAAEQ
jgi:iron complex transport system substrate-binding protein